MTRTRDCSEKYALKETEPWRRVNNLSVVRRGEQNVWNTEYRTEYSEFRYLEFGIWCLEIGSVLDF